MGKAYVYNGTTYQVYWQTSYWPTWYWMTVTSSASSYDCSGFQYANEYLWVWVCRIKNTGSSATTLSYRADLQAYVSWSWVTRRVEFNNQITLNAGATQQLRLIHVLGENEIDSTATSYRIRVVAADSDGSTTMYTNFTISNCPPLPSTDITLQSLTVGKSLMNGWSVLQTFWWKEVWSIDFSSIWYADSTSNDSTINCSWLQIWHYVWVSNLVLNIPSSIWTDVITLRYELQWYINWSWETLYTHIIWDTTVIWWYYRSWWEVSWITNDMIWTNTNTYRVRWVWVSQWGNGSWEHLKWFNISNLSISTTKWVPWCLWIEWTNLCFTDADWYKHAISYDSGSQEAIWNTYSWSLRLSDSWLTNMRKINYVTANWFRYKTHLWRLKNFWRSTAPWTDYRWSVWVTLQYSLAFVSANWDVVYLGNWDV